MSPAVRSRPVPVALTPTPPPHPSGDHHHVVLQDTGEDLPLLCVRAADDSWWLEAWNDRRGPLPAWTRDLDGVAHPDLPEKSVARYAQPHDALEAVWPHLSAATGYSRSELERWLSPRLRPR